MYNRYVGNTGKSYIVEDAPDTRPYKSVVPSKVSGPPPKSPPVFSGNGHNNESERKRAQPKSGGLDFLKGFLPRGF